MNDLEADKKMRKIRFASLVSGESTSLDKQQEKEKRRKSPEEGGLKNLGRSARMVRNPRSKSPQANIKGSPPEAARPETRREQRGLEINCYWCINKNKQHISQPIFLPVVITKI